MTLLQRHWDLLLLLFFSALLVLLPQLDLEAAAYFYDPTKGDFTLVGDPIVEIPYVWVPRLMLLFTLILMILTAISFFRRWQKRKPMLFLLLSLLIGPGLLINAFMKETWARARPYELTQFGGQMQFTRAWQLEGECTVNCSFVSGHASAGFYFLTPAFLFVGWRRKLWFATGWGLGAYIGWVRMAQGGHFLSDVILSGFAVYFAAKVLYWLMYESSWARSKQE